MATLAERLQAEIDRANTTTSKTDTTVHDAIGSLIDGYGVGSVICENPSYFYSETADTLSKLSNLRTDGTLFIAFITDSHIYTSSNNKQYFDAQMASMKAVCTAIKPDLVVHGGDMTNGSESKATTIAFTDDVVKQMREVGGDDTLILIGNHDGNYVSSTQAESEMITEAEMLSMYRSWDDGFNYPTDKLYGYRDYNDFSIRVIRLHSYMGDGTLGGTGTNWGYPTDEVEWFTNTALNTDYDILILSHQTLSPVLQGYAESQDIPHNGMSLQQAIDSWQNDNRHCIGVIHGHVHWDYVHTGKGTYTVIDHNTKEEISRTASYGDFYEYSQGCSNYLTTFGTSDSTPSSSYRDVPKGAISYGRKAGTETQALWTAIIVNPSTHKIDFIRFGAGNDLSIDYTDTTITEPLSITSFPPNTVSLMEDDEYTAAIIVTGGTSPYTFEWEYRASSSSEWAPISSLGFTAISDDNSSQFNIGGKGIMTTAFNGFQLRCTVTDSEGTSITSNTATLSVTAIVNALTSSISADGTPYNGGTGYKSGYRLSSNGNESAQSGCYVSGFIPFTKGDKLTIQDFNVVGKSGITGYNYCYIAGYDLSFTKVLSNYAKDWSAQSANSAVIDSNNYISEITLNIGVNGTNIDNVAYIRLSAVSIGDEPAIYVN